MNDRRNTDMTNGRKGPESVEITDFDLMAYVEGRLDPHRRSQVDAWLAERPEAADDVQTDIAVTEAIRTLYNPVMTEPVPDRLEAVLQGPSGRWRGRAMRGVAMAASVLGAGLVGWWAGGQTQAPSGLAMDQRLLSQVTTAYTDGTAFDGTGDISSVAASVGAGDGAGAGNGAGDGPLEAVSALNERMTFEVRAPDLTALGYTMVGQRVAETGQGDIVEVNYADASGDRLALFMTTRWQETQPRFRATQQNDVSTAYWYDGPLALALAGDAEPEIIRDLGISVHDLMEAGGLSNPALTGPSVDSEPAFDTPDESAGSTTTAAGSSSTEMDSASAPPSSAPEQILVPESVVRPTPVQQSDREM